MRYHQQATLKINKPCFVFLICVLDFTRVFLLTKFPATRTKIKIKNKANLFKKNIWWDTCSRHIFRVLITASLKRAVWMVYQGVAALVLQRLDSAAANVPRFAASLRTWSVESRLLCQTSASSLPAVPWWPLIQCRVIFPVRLLSMFLMSAVPAEPLLIALINIGCQFGWPRMREMVRAARVPCAWDMMRW